MSCVDGRQDRLDEELVERVGFLPLREVGGVFEPHPVLVRGGESKAVMNVLVATSKTQGQRASDFHFAHDGELVDLLSDLYTPWHFGDAVSVDGLVFDHRLQPGRATTRNAIALLRLHGAPETLIKDALACATELDRQRGSTLVGR